MEVRRCNFDAVWPYLLASLKNADFISLDLELSGLGSRLATVARNIEDRYTALREAARTRSILSLGLAFFKKIGKSETKRRIKFQCQVFNILSLCAEPFIVEPDALEFLARHSFDFNKLIGTGVRYYPSTASKESPLQSLVTELFSCCAPLILHNGFVDLAFLYHHFYSPLPDSFGEFCNALADLFPWDSPLCDTKYLAENHTRMTASFLEYVFRKWLFQRNSLFFSQGDNVREAIASRWYLTVLFDDSTSMIKTLRQACEKVDCRLPENFPDHVIPCDLREQVCEQFSVGERCLFLFKGCLKVQRSEPWLLP
ncbi:CAF1 family ribonuclease [Necator americanus]|uniref:CAF1 family ribonuclease n=1 Tax=Necator americanus TaxID=51031 RepID=W2TWH1_NECAM|nr:CAF1 family ribonuclease [Necator americanus]ETN86024.1 CAF1 family ribonuclease [Necator americanus]